MGQRPVKKLKDKIIERSHEVSGTNKTSRVDWARTRDITNDTGPLPTL